MPLKPQILRPKEKEHSIFGSFGKHICSSGREVDCMRNNSIQDSWDFDFFDPADCWNPRKLVQGHSNEQHEILQEA